MRLHRTSPLPRLASCSATFGLLLLAFSGCSEGRRPAPRELSSSAGAAGAAGAAGSQGLAGNGFIDGFIDGSAGDSGAPGDGGGASPSADGGALAPYVLPPSVSISDAGVVSCGTAPCACNNGSDDDGDGKVDGFDEECTGALDDDEGTFSTGVPGDNSDPKWQDCFFDGNSGAGDDHCRYHADCLSGAKPATDPDCAVSAECHDFCETRTPNGCDCFGCCTVWLDDATSVGIFIGEACSLEDVADETRCPRCTPSTACGNTCAECELCPGKSVEDLPESCGPSGGSGGGSSEPAPPAYTCDAGRAVCATSADCVAGQYCSLGCCLDFVIY